MSYHVREQFPHDVRHIEHLFIPMPDGARLAARMWLPHTADAQPVPAVFEYIPYRKRDFMRARDEPMHRYLAGHGYAALRVDLRGSGDSDGILHDEYLPQEIADAEAVIAWLREQAWCDGNVGMTGISWGGFNSLQVAAKAPPGLQAIVTLCASDDRYADDAHYMGGCLLNENQIWGTVLFALNALPPDPQIVGDGWREQWLARLHNDRPFPSVWLHHQRRDGYWRSGSVCEDYGAIRCPVYAIGGWADGYSNAVLRLMSRLPGARKGLIGPWAHAFPHDALPGPAIGYLQEAVRWWDHWLKGRDTGMMDEPMVRAWLQYPALPTPTHGERAGRWIAEHTWPPANRAPLALSLAPSQLLTAPAVVNGTIDIQSPQTTGTTGGDWCGFGGDGEAPTDQRADDGRSACFDHGPLSTALEIFGTPRLHLKVSADAPVAMLAARLTEVFPDGTSTLVTYGLLNLTHRDDHAAPTALEPGKFYDVVIELNDIAHQFAQGAVVRVAISTSYWPLAWPAPTAVTLSIDAQSALLELPSREPQAQDSSLKPFAAPEAAPTTTTQSALRPARFTRTFSRDLTTHETVYRLRSEGGDLGTGAEVHIDAIGMDLGHTVERRFTIGETDPTSAEAFIEEKILMRRDGWDVRIFAACTLTASSTEFVVRAQLRATENGNTVFERDWDERIARDLI